MRPAAGVEDREALRDLTTPGDKDTRRRQVWQERFDRNELQLFNEVDCTFATGLLYN